MNNKEKIERKIKIELELFKMYCFFLIGLVTGIYSILISEIYNTNQVAFVILIIGIVFFLVVTILLVNSYIKLNKLKK